VEAWAALAQLAALRRELDDVRSALRRMHGQPFGLTRDAVRRRRRWTATASNGPRGPTLRAGLIQPHSAERPFGR
jgi:hypothetical protein